MSDECAKLSFPFKTQFNNTVPIVEGLQQHCLLEGAPILTNAASSKDVPATMLTDEHNRAKDGRTYRVHTQLLESKEQKVRCHSFLLAPSAIPKTTILQPQVAILKQSETQRPSC